MNIKQMTEILSIVLISFVWVFINPQIEVKKIKQEIMLKEKGWKTYMKWTKEDNKYIIINGKIDGKIKKILICHQYALGKELPLEVVDQVDIVICCYAETLKGQRKKHIFPSSEGTVKSTLYRKGKMGKLLLEANTYC